MTKKKLMLIIALKSDQIKECYSVFWKEKEKYIKSDFLSIKGNELMTIFLYIIIKIIKSQIFLFLLKWINFTISTLKLTTIGYYYSTLEVTIFYIEQLTDIKKVIKRNAQLRLSSISLSKMIH